jgi:hypothetical protein
MFDWQVKLILVSAVTEANICMVATSNRNDSKISCGCHFPLKRRVSVTPHLEICYHSYVTGSKKVSIGNLLPDSRDWS